jgi:hypothetical protein
LTARTQFFDFFDGKDDDEATLGLQPASRKRQFFDGNGGRRKRRGNSSTATGIEEEAIP